MEFLNQIGPVFIIIGAISAAVICYRPYLGLLGMIFMIPLGPVLAFSSGFTAIKAVGIITFASFGLHCLLRKETIEIDFRVLLPLIVFLIWATVRLEVNYLKLLTLTQLITFFVMISSMCSSNNRRIDFVIWTFIIGCVVATAMSSYGYLSNPALSARASVEAQNANEYAVNVSIAILLLLLVKTRFKGYKMLIPYGIAILFIYGLIISASRGAVVAISLSLLVYLIVNRNRLKSMANILIICLLVGTILVVGLQTGIISEFSVKRIDSTKSSEETTMAVRFAVWRVGWKMINDNFITGVGLGNFNVNFNKYADIVRRTGRDPHSVYVSVFAETGAIGFLIALWFIGALSYTAMRTTSENKVFSLCILVFIAIVSLKGTYHMTKIFWFSIASALLTHYPKDRKAQHKTG